jgi:hypothetical protein
MLIDRRCLVFFRGAYRSSPRALQSWLARLHDDRSKIASYDLA